MRAGKWTWWLMVLLVLGFGIGWQAWWPGSVESDCGPPPAEVPAAEATTAEAGAAAAAHDGVAGGVADCRMAYRMRLAGERVDLLAVEELRGEFHGRRGRMARFPGMLQYRLVDAADQVLAEETMAAPDRTCVVLHPQTVDASIRAAAAGPVVVQVRLPVCPAAVRLEVSRVTAGRPGADEVLLASIPLPR